MAQLRSHSLGLIVLLAAALAAPFLRVSYAAEVCAPVLARVVSLQGIVELRSSESEPWSDAALNDLLCVDYWIRVGPFSRAALALPNDSVLRLDQQTTVRLRARAEQTRSLLDLFLGTLHLFSHRPHALEIDTPFVNAATEGTEFLVSVGADQTRIIVFEGRVLAQNPDGELLLASGDAAVAPAGEAPRAQIVAQPRDAVAWTLYYPPILTALAAREPGPRALPPGLQTAVDRVAANDYPGALRALDTVPDGARDARYYTYRAGVLLNVGRVDGARDAIGRALALDPAAGEALAQRSIIALVQDRRDEASADATRAVELSPDSAAVRIALSYAQQATFQLEAARATLREAVEIAPEDALAWARLSEIELSFGELRAALGAANRAVALAPELSRTQTVLGFADLPRFAVGEAKTAFERAIGLDSADPLPRLGLGLALTRQSDLEQGRNEIEIAVALDPDNSLLRSYLGKAFFEEKRDRQAGEQYAIAKRLDPLDPTPWLYDAIRLQTENRPIEALRDLNRSIALNDNRAVYRSSLLLDEDLATRQVSLARIYDDLGFEEVGLLEATRSLSLNPANSSAHRFLSDVYAGLPRHEIARASELLQAQLLQPININPVQPSLAITDINVLAGTGPAEAAFGDFTPMFQRNDVQLTTTGVVGTNTTLGDEVVASALWNRYSVSAGQYHFQTDGFRPNNDFKNNVYNVFTQVAVTPKLGIQAEYRRRDSDLGDLALNFDPDAFSDVDRRDITTDMGRVGLRLSPTPSSDALLSLSSSRREEKLETEIFDAPLTIRAIDKGYQGEAQYIFDHDFFNTVFGGGLADVDVKETEVEEGFPRLEEHSNIKQRNIYSYNHVQIPMNIIWTAALSYDYLDEGQLNIDKVNPKLGVRWNILENLQARFAVFRTIKRPLVINQTIEPTEVAGFNQFFDEINGTEALQYGGGIDTVLMENIYGGFEIARRELQIPDFIGFPTERVETVKSDKNLYRTYLQWSAGTRWALGSAFEVEDFESKDLAQVGLPVRTHTISVPTFVRYFDPSGLFAEVVTTFVAQDLNLKQDSQTTKDHDSFFLLDAAVGYRLPERSGIISLEATNLLNQNFRFQARNVDLAEPVNPRFIPERTVLARLTLNF